MDLLLIRLCDCKEALAGYAHWPDDMHRHAGCVVYHAGKVCQIPEAQPSLDFTSERNTTPTAGTAGADFKGDKP